MIKKSILLLMIFMATLAFSNTNKHITSETFTVKKLDIAKFKKNQRGGVYKSEFNGSKIEQRFSSQDNLYKEIISYANSPYRERNYYYADGSLKESNERTFSGVISVTTRYKPDGSVLERIDYDKDFKFSVNDLHEKMKREYGLRVIHSNVFLTLDRYNDQSLPVKTPHYIIIFPQEVNSQLRPVMVTILIDGTTGETLQILGLGDGNGFGSEDAYAEYLKKHDVQGKQ